MSCHSNEELDRYIETISDIDPDEYNNNQYADMDIDSEPSTVIIAKNKHHHRRNDAVSADSGCVVVYRQVNGRQAKVACYETHNSPNRFIRDAVTGAFMPYRVGSKDEDLFFSILVATGENGKREPMLLFYDNPEQYERHFYTELPKQAKNAWLQKVMAARNAQASVPENPPEILVR
jgi:hypothetical protein